MMGNADNKTVNRLAERKANTADNIPIRLLKQNTNGHGVNQKSEIFLNLSQTFLQFFCESDIIKGNYQSVNAVFMCTVRHDFDRKPTIVTCRNLFFTENKSMKNLAGLVNQCRILAVI